MYVTTVTQKGQVTIPAEIRKNLELKKGTKVEFKQKNGEVILSKLADFLSLRGSLKSSKRYSKREARKAIGRYLANKHARILKEV